MPVWPTWSVCGRQPALVTTREQPTAPPSSAASSSMIAKPSAEPTPRPPLTTTLASTRETPAGRGCDAVHDADGEVGLGQRRRERLDPGGGAGRLRRDRVRRDREQLHGRVDARLLEQAAAPAHARHLVAAHLGAVRRERQVEARRDAREHLVAPIRARRDDGAGREPLDELGDGRGPRRGRVRALELGDVEDVGGDLRGRAHRDRVHGPAERARECERLERELVAGLDENEDVMRPPAAA